MLNLNHKNLDVWKISVELVADIYELTETIDEKMNELFAKISNLINKSK